MGSYKLNVEVGYDGRYTMVRPSELPGCISKSRDHDAALDNAAGEIERHIQWFRAHAEDIEATSGAIQVEKAEEFICLNDGSYEVNAFFATDGEPVYPAEIRTFLRWMDYSRQDLIDLVRGVPYEALDSAPGHGKRSLREVLDHVAKAEFWYLTRLDAAGSPTFRRGEDFPLEPFLRLRTTREFAVERLTNLTAQERSRLTFHQGEQWSARKVFRRFLEHENEHRKEIASRYENP
ncbi:MAG: DinB family protein [bacterium]